MMMRAVMRALLLCLFAANAVADDPPFEDALLDKLVGSWLMTGTIAGGEVVHDVEINWVLGHRYVRIDDVARETNEDGGPAYEATVFIGWDKPTGRYVCLWLDLTGGGGLANDVFGYAEPAADRLEFTWGDDEGRIRNTFQYFADTDSWTWSIDNEKHGVATPFGRVALARK